MSTSLLLTHRHPRAEIEQSAFYPTLAEAMAGTTAHIVCPYISVRLLRSLLTNSRRLRLLTDASAWIRAFARKDRTTILQFIRDHVEGIRTTHGLHAKVVIGSELAYVGSANLTFRGVYAACEAGVALRSREDVSRRRKWFDAHWEAAERVDMARLERLAVEAPEPSHPADDSADQADEQTKLVEARARMPNRSYATRYLDFLDLATRALEVDEADPRIALSLPSSGYLPFTINNRYSVVNDQSRTEIDVIFSSKYLKTANLKPYRRYLFRYRDGTRSASSAPAFVSVHVRDLDHAKLLSAVMTSMREQLDRASRSANRRHHSPLAWAAIKNSQVRDRVLASAFDGV